MVRGLVGAATGEDVSNEAERVSDRAGDYGIATREPRVARSEYLRGPVPGWEYRILRRHPYWIPPALFQVDLFGGACPGLHLAGGGSETPFTVFDVRPGFQFIELAPSHAADLYYYRPGEVTLAGMSDPALPQAFARVEALGGGACTSVGIPLLSLGRPVRYSALR
jgi:hypothetical protein